MYSHQSFEFPKGGFLALLVLPFYVWEVSMMHRKCWICSLWSGDFCTLCNTLGISINKQKFVTVTLLLCGIMFFWQCIELETQTCKQMLRLILLQEPERVLSCVQQTLTSLFNCIRHWLKKYFFVSVKKINTFLSFINNTDVMEAGVFWLLYWIYMPFFFPQALWGLHLNMNFSYLHESFSTVSSPGCGSDLPHSTSRAGLQGRL